jgi:hypothetical protein
MTDYYSLVKQLVRTHAVLMRYAMLPPELARLDAAICEALEEERDETHHPR